MNTILHKAESRGSADYGWLKTSYTFSFANYYDPTRIHFGTLRVLNDDWIAGGQGFGKHPHDNMEIITIMLSGELEHKDSMGHISVLKENEVQVMTAGTGITHSEYNHLPNVPVQLLQIWVFPEKQNLAPGYDQKKFDPELRKNQWQLLVSPNIDNSLTIHQNAFFSIAKLDDKAEIIYTLHQKNNGVYAFIISGSVVIAGIDLNKRDGLGIWDFEQLSLKANEFSEILIIEVPMHI